MRPGGAPGSEDERAPGSVVLLRCPPHLFALDSGAVERLLLTEEARFEEAPQGAGPSRAYVSGLAWAAWDLGLLLGAARQSAALVLLRQPRTKSGAGVALRTGPCIAVKRLPATLPLPRGIFAGRPGAVTRCFEAAAALGKPDEALLGYLLDPEGLWTEAELSASEALAGPRSDPPAKEPLP